MLGKRKSKKTKRIDTLVGPRSEVWGDIKFSGGLHIEGTIKGNVIAENDSKSLVQLGESGTVEGEIRAPFVVLSGETIGDVYGEHVELAPKARVTGNVYYSLIEMAAGAEVNGKLVHMSEQEQPYGGEEAQEPHAQAPEDTPDTPDTPALDYVVHQDST